MIELDPTDIEWLQTLVKREITRLRQVRDEILARPKGERLPVEETIVKMTGENLTYFNELLRKLGKSSGILKIKS